MPTSRIAVAAGLPVLIHRQAAANEASPSAAAKLAERRALDLDAPVQSLAPGLNPKWPPPTPRQLAAHTASVPHYQARDGAVQYASVGEALTVFKDRDLLFAPGARLGPPWSISLTFAAQ